jgi:LruC domain-containing protein
MSRFSRRLSGLALAFSLLGGAAACQNRSDPNFAWFIGLAAILPAVPDPANLEDPQAIPDPQEEVPFEIDIRDVSGETDFILDTTRNIPVYINVVDAVGAPIQGTRVRVYELVNGAASPTENALFYAVTQGEGNCQGVLTLNRTTPSVMIEANYNGQIISMQLELAYIQEIRRTINVLGVRGPIVVPDQDQDGAPDAEDAYPLDPLRASIASFPGPDEYYTIAYEDLYPTQGDADFNDYVVRARFTEDRNAAGDVVRVRGWLQHVAKGAGYNHVLRLTAPGAGRAQFSLRRTDAAGVELSASQSIVEAAAHLELLGRSDQTISQSNTASGQTLTPGHQAEFELILETPLAKTAIGGAPYDLYLRVLNTGKDIHFPRQQLDSNGADLYVDASGFPWALLVPGDFAWPRERTNIHQAYDRFQNWYASAGTADLDWYLFPNANIVFPVAP